MSGFWRVCSVEVNKSNPSPMLLNLEKHSRLCTSGINLSVTSQIEGQKDEQTLAKKMLKN